MRKKSTDEYIRLAVDNISADNVKLSSDSDNALSIFRSTANRLATINEKLQENMNKLSELANFVNDQKSKTGSKMKDNEEVRKRILEIIGE